MSDYTPTTEQVRDGYRYDPEAEYYDPITPHHVINGRAFDRWLDKFKRQTQAEALFAAASHFAVEHDQLVPRGDVRRWLEESARKIEGRGA